MKIVIVKGQEMGTNCWSAVRHTGGECCRVDRCKYPEKAKCKAYQTKRVYHQERIHADGWKEKLNA